MRILLLSAYEAASHEYWRLGLQAYFSESDWQILSLPPRYFNWRIRSNSLTWAYDHKDTLVQEYDLIVSTSMVDLSSLRGMVPHIAKIPTLLYFHENQFAYPESAQGKHHLEPKIVSLYSALCSDLIVFNSEYNRTTFMEGVAKLLTSMPDCVPSGIVDALRQKSEILPVAIQVSELQRQKETPPFTLVWNHRWEYDKGPARLLNFLSKLPRQKDYLVHVVGQRFRQTPETFAEIRVLLEQRGWLGRWGYIENRQEYERLLASSHVVCSTACHDFQGIAMLEAMALGAIPLAPNRLAYRAFIPSRYLYQSDLTQPSTEANHAVEKLLEIESNYPETNLVSEMEAFSWPHLGPKYEEAFHRTVTNFHNGIENSD